MKADFKDMTPEAAAARDQMLATADWRLYGCSLARMRGTRCELMEGHEGPCKYVHRGTWYESSAQRRNVAP